MAREKNTSSRLSMRLKPDLDEFLNEVMSHYNVNMTTAAEWVMRTGMPICKQTMLEESKKLQEKI